jgi:hypothetical protein
MVWFRRWPPDSWVYVALAALGIGFLIAGSGAVVAAVVLAGGFLIWPWVLELIDAARGS